MYCYTLSYLYCYTLSYLILSDSIQSKSILSYSILFDFIPPYSILFHSILAHPILSCFTLFYPISLNSILPYSILFRPILSYPIRFYLVSPYSILFHPLLSYYTLFYPTLFYPFSLDSSLPYPILSSLVLSFLLFPSILAHLLSIFLFYEIQFGGRQKGGKGGKSGLIMSRDRGRYLRPVVPKDGEPVRVAIDATLREAAKNQIWRRKEAALLGKDTSRIFLEPSDVRAKLMARKAGSLLIFAVDASGSMALNRMTAAKGAACGLLTEAYQSRDKICLIPFQGKSAEV